MHMQGIACILIAVLTFGTCIMTSAWLIVVFSFAALLSSCLCAPWAVNASARASQELWHSIKLNGDDYIIYWSADSVHKVIKFAVSVRTTGWVGFGLSPNGQMPNSDVVIGWMDENKVPHFTVNSIVFYCVSYHVIQYLYGLLLCHSWLYSSL